ncbi:MAG: DNA recombination protein RmuC [Candidatus Brocadiales bacterium]|nr:DNA recombination protein RmuC [Candidatus Bathyanammoxibius amoris]
MELMNLAILFLLVLLVGICVWIAVAFMRRGKGEEALMLQQQLNDMRNETRQSLGQLTEQVGERLHSHQELLMRSHEALGSRLDNAAKVVGDVQNKLGQLHQTTNRVVEISKDIASLQDILRPPKLRGGFGEFLLTDMLTQIIPQDRYEFQYQFKSGDRVDAVIMLGERLVPIDAKFPLENFKRCIEADDADIKKRARKEFLNNVKKHIDTIAEKYIRPAERTFDFALMYIPAENVYYETIVKDESAGGSISGYAMRKKVIPVSPNTFYLYLQTILLGLRGMRLEERVEEVLEHLQALRGDFGRFGGDFETLGKHLRNSLQKYEDAGKDLDKFGARLEHLEPLGESKSMPAKKIESPPAPQEAQREML